jgi:hypothetical protein
MRLSRNEKCSKQDLEQIVIAGQPLNFCCIVSGVHPEISIDHAQALPHNMDTIVALYSSFAIIQIDELHDLQRGVSRDGLALLDPGLVPQFEPQQVYMNCWNEVSLLVGTPSDFTWMTSTTFMPSFSTFVCSRLSTSLNRCH